jgi:putative CocE/NonD family hydrolase
MKPSSTPTRRIAGAGLAKAAAILLMIAVTRAWAAAPDFEFHPPATVADPAVSEIVRDLAARLIPVYEEADPDQYLANLSALQLATGDYASADVSRESLRDRRRKADSRRPVGRSVIYDIYAHAKAVEADRHMAFSEAFAKSFREDVSKLDDHDAYVVTRWFGRTLPPFREALQKAFDRQRGRDRIDETDAVALIWAYVSFDAYRAFGPVVDSLVAEDDQRRYTDEEDVAIRTPDGLDISAVVIRPRNAAKPLPTLFEFTTHEPQNYAKECAAHGYVGVVAYVRAAERGADRTAPYQHDGDDARAVIDWIAKQSWSDGSVGMYGEGYSGFTAWAAAKRLPPELKAIATAAARAPGINVPMAGNIFRNSAYRWSLQMTGKRASDEPADRDDGPWRELDQKWYKSGMRYRDLGRLFGQPNPVFIRWLNHPSYDRYWQKMVPYRDDFAHINIPVLTMTGYFADAEPGDLYYFTQHRRFNPHADHMLLIGPYDDTLMQHGAAAGLRGYAVDSAAQLDLRELRYRWFDRVLKSSPSPPELKEEVNFEVMGANAWRHAPSLEAMGQRPLRFYLDAAAPGEAVQRLAARKKTKFGFVQQTVSLTDRADAGWMPPADLVINSVMAHNGQAFVSEPLSQPTEVSGLFSGQLDITVNKMDIDLYISLYELLPSGEYIRLFGPTDELRASYLQDRVHRHLLKAGERQTLTYKGERLTSRQLQTGSRLVMVLGINKRPDREINYGTGNDVSEDTAAEGRIPIKIRWYGDSYIEIPMRR